MEGHITGTIVARGEDSEIFTRLGMLHRVSVFERLLFHTLKCNRHYHYLTLLLCSHNEE